MTDRIAELEFHPAAMMFPEMDQDDLNKLYESIKRNGFTTRIVLYQGKLLDGRNRVRAALMCGMPAKDLPHTTLPAEADPFEFAWMMNCERLDYSPKKKAELRLEIEKASGELEATRQAAVESRRAKVSAARKTQADPADRGERQVAATSAPEAGGRTAAKIAERAGVSTRTMERVIAAKSGKPKGVQLPRKISAATMWRVPRSVSRLATFLLQRLPSDEIRKLIKLLAEAGEAAA